MNDSYIYVIVALLPLAAVMLTVQVNPYNALTYVTATDSGEKH